MSKMDSVVPEKLSINSKIKFRCHKGIQCFTKCCSGIEILLTPYDIIRLKKRLDMSSGEFLEQHTYMKIDDQSSNPLAILKLNDDDNKSCPFLNADGCSIYTDRPANCRYYPVGQGALRKEDKDKNPFVEEFYFLIKEPHCLGHNEDKEWTIKEWLENQEADQYDEFNKEWKSILLRKNLPGRKVEDSKQFQIYLASYDMDMFKKYIFESKFLDVFDVDADTLEKIKTDEVELMQFGFKYIKFIMMLEETMKLKDGAEKFKKKS